MADPVNLVSKFVVGEKYRLRLPENWVAMDRRGSEWNNQIVTFVKTITDINDAHPDELSYNDPGPFTCGVKCPGKASAYLDNLFLAKPEWLFSPKPEWLFEISLLTTRVKQWLSHIRFF